MFLSDIHYVFDSILKQVYYLSALEEQSLLSINLLS